MADFIICGHGRFASGVKSGIELIFGPQERIGTVEFLDGETKTELDAKMARELDAHAGADGVLVFCDVLQGSPFQSAVACSLGRGDVRVLFGANVAMVLECVARSLAGEVPLDDLVDIALEAGRVGMGDFRARAEDVKDDDWD